MLIITLLLLGFVLTAYIFHKQVFNIMNEEDAIKASTLGAFM